MGTPIGQHGRLPPGESWCRAMQEVARRRAGGATRRYRVRGYRIEEGWYAYRVVKVARPQPAPPVPEPMTRERIAELSAQLPRCAQRSRANHGGNSKVAWPSYALADEVAAFLGFYAYECPLAAPAIGEHWHTSTSKKGSKRR